VVKVVREGGVASYDLLEKWGKGHKGGRFWVRKVKQESAGRIKVPAGAAKTVDACSGAEGGGQGSIKRKGGAGSLPKSQT